MATVKHNGTGEIHIAVNSGTYDLGGGGTQWSVIADPNPSVSLDLQVESGGVWSQPKMEAAQGFFSGCGVHGNLTGAISGRYTSLATNAGALSTIAAAANRLDLVPFIPALDMTISEFAVEVTTLLAASNARIGVFASLTTGEPGALLASSGDLSCATVGAKAWAPTQAIIFKKRVVYWLGVLSSGAQTYRGIPVAALLPLSNPATGTAMNTLRRLTQTFTSGMPANPAAGTDTSAIAPWIRMKFA